MLDVKLYKNLEKITLELLFGMSLFINLQLRKQNLSQHAFEKQLSRCVHSSEWWLLAICPNSVSQTHGQESLGMYVNKSICSVGES